MYHYHYNYIPVLDTYTHIHIILCAVHWQSKFSIQDFSNLGVESRCKVLSPLWSMGLTYEDAFVMIATRFFPLRCFDGIQSKMRNNHVLLTHSRQQQHSEATEPDDFNYTDRSVLCKRVHGLETMTTTHELTFIRPLTRFGISFVFRIVFRGWESTRV